MPTAQLDKQRQGMQAWAEGTSYVQCVVNPMRRVFGCKQARSNAAYQRLHSNGTALAGWHVKAFQTYQTGT